MLFSNKKEQNSTDMCNHRDEPPHYMMGKEPDTKDHISYNSICMKYLERISLQRQKEY